MSIDEVIAKRLLALRKSKGLNLEQLAELSEVSKAMISKIERQESSPSATILGRLAAGLGVSITQLLSDDSDRPKHFMRRDEQAVWRDPDIGYLRRQVLPPEAQTALEMIEVTLPAKSRVSYPSWGNRPYKQRLWLVEGELTVHYGENCYSLLPGDVLVFGVDLPVTFDNVDAHPCRYLLVINQG